MNQAHKIGFLIILRPGPYICGEHDYGALPWWLLSDGIDRIQPRTSEATYMKAVTRWFDVLLPKLVPYLYNNGGPIIMVQVENEYGSFPACDYEYTGQLRDLFRKYLGDETFLFTTGNIILKKKDLDCENFIDKQNKHIKTKIYLFYR